MVKWLFVLLASCATVNPTAPKKRSPLPTELVGQCVDLPTPPPHPLPKWEPLVLASDLEVWNQHACEPLERTLTPLAQVNWTRQSLQEECAAKAVELPERVRASCRAVCAAHRWIDARALGRQRSLETMEWFRAHLDEVFDRALVCPATKFLGGQLDDARVRAFFACVGLPTPPSDVEFLMQTVGETVRWMEKGNEVSSSRAVEIGSLQVTSKDESQPWRFGVWRCKRGEALSVVMQAF